MTRSHFKTLKGQGAGYWMAVAVLVALTLAGYLAAHTMDTNGHWISGMSNQVVWGLPHVFAVFLILAASGALNIASLGSVFGKEIYKPWGRFSALLAICLLVGWLIVLVLDLGRPERLVVAMTHYNFKSIFAWNIFLYTGFIAVVVGYLWTMFERGANTYSKQAGLVAFIWRFVLTSGTGSIFGFLVARQLFDAAMMVPMFIVLSLVLGTAVFLLVFISASRWSGAGSQEAISSRLSSLLGVFIAAELFLVAAFHLTNLYATEHHGVERFILAEGGIYTTLFWVGQVILGGALPLCLIFLTEFTSRTKGAVTVALLAIAGGLSQVYVTIIGGQAYPQLLFPGKTVSSSFYDGVVAAYSPKMPEVLLGIGGVGLALVLLIVVTRVLPFLPDQDRASTGA